jgi:16S rRNA (cytosine1407-C5)-methyltransferase
MQMHQDVSIAMSASGLEYYRHLVSSSEIDQLVRTMERPLKPAIRVNTLKIDVDEARRTWPRRYDWRIQPLPFCAEGWQITEHRGDLGLGRTLEHKMGFYYIQDAASMLPAEMFRYDGDPHSSVLDMAAAPGGKTTHLVCKLNDRGLFVANDSSARRIGALRSNLQDWGAMGSVITNYPGERYGNWFPEAFDKVLLDAPCSGENLRVAERRKSRFVSTKERQRLYNRQVGLLTSAFQAVKPGGEIVYATCTLAPQEDEAVLDALLSLYPREATIESVDHVLPIPAPGLLSDGERQFSVEIRSAVRLWPHLYDTSGFFAAKIGKRDSVSVQRHVPPRQSLPEAGLNAMSCQEQVGVVNYLLDAYGFNLADVVEKQSLTFWKREESVYLIPELFLSLFADLRCVTMGMLLGIESEKGFIPSHELVARFSSHFVERRLPISNEQSKIWLTGRDIRGLDALPHTLGTVILLEDDEHRFLGRGKVLGNRIRNMLPRRLVY